MRYLAILLCALSLSAQAPNRNAVHYTKQVLVPKDKHKPATVTIVYDDLYPGKRGTGGGCYFMDVTKPGSYMPIVEDKPDHVTIRARRGHVVEWHCNWNPL